MKLKERAFFITILLIVLIGIPKVVFGFKDYSETKGQVGIFELGDSYEVLMDKVKYLESKKLVVFRDTTNAEKYFSVAYKDELTDNSVTQILMVLDELADTKIVSSIWVLSRTTASSMVKDVNQIKRLYSEAELLYENREYFTEFSKDGEAIVTIFVWYIDYSYLELTISYVQEEKYYNLILRHTLKKPELF